MNKEAAVLGFLIGDAIGVPFEFNDKEDLQNIDKNLFILPTPTENRRHKMAPPNAWSDDGAQFLALYTSLIRSETFDINDFGKSLLEWQMEKRFAVNDIIFDMGIQTKKSLQKMRMGIPVDECGGESEYDNGNGSLMRVLALPLWHNGSDEELVDFAYDQCLPTHAHVRSQVCTAIYCLWARELLNGSNDGFDDALNKFKNICKKLNYKKSLEELELFLSYEDKEPGGTGYVIDTLWSVRYAFKNSNNFNDAVVNSIRMGPDTDTVAALTCGLAGIKFGMDSIPKNWIDLLPKDPDLSNIIDFIRSENIINVKNKLKLK